MKNLGLLLIFSLLFACTQFEVSQTEEAVFKNLSFDYSDNALDERFNSDQVALGRVLFYDNILSKNGNVSCASCHKQEFAFGDDVPFSEGFLEGETTRNSPTLINNKFNSTFFWDARTDRLDLAVSLPIFDHLEMGMTERDLVERVNNAEYYNELWEKAYGTREVSRHAISAALASFVGSIISVESELDGFLKSNNASDISDDAHAGLELFETHCNACHTALGDAAIASTPQNSDPYMGSGSRNLVNIGLPDVERADVNLRIPSLRNIASTGPYMHDGRFETLREVIDHYNDGVQHNKDLVDFRLLDDNRDIKKLNLSEKEKDQIEAFLLTLSDSNVQTNERWSDPFVR